MKKRKLLFGVGINDADYPVSWTTGEKRFSCRYYDVWRDMLKRCYCPKYQAKYPTYIGCTVVPEWLYFMTFRAWMVRQDWEGKQLDKDLLIDGNKRYNDKTCWFVTNKINNILTNCGAARGKYSEGVCKPGMRFTVKIRLNIKRKHLGTFDTEEDAVVVYRRAKGEYIRQVANEQSDMVLKAALYRQADKYYPDFSIIPFHLHGYRASLAIGI